jgi:hypothetical protein
MAHSLWTAWNCYNESIIDPTLLSKGIDSVAKTKKKISDNFEEENRENPVKNQTQLVALLHGSRHLWILSNPFF